MNFIKRLTTVIAGSSVSKQEISMYLKHFAPGWSCTGLKRTNTGDYQASLKGPNQEQGSIELSSPIVVKGPKIPKQKMNDLITSLQEMLDEDPSHEE